MYIYKGLYVTAGLYAVFLVLAVLGLVQWWRSYRPPSSLLRSPLKVVLTGSESSGKTELARRLGEHFAAPVAGEFVRSYAAQRGGTLDFADHGPIARGQMAGEDAAMAKARDLVVLDTDLVSTVVYCEHYFGRAPEWIESEARARAGDLYLLLRPDVPWVADGVRDRSGSRDEMHALFRRKLDQLGLRYVEIGGERDQRLRESLDAIAVARTR
jgi:NadR type nicotinamide-nucleotide adenylyltransferase